MPGYADLKSVLCFGDPKQAALYFDRVFALFQDLPPNVQHDLRFGPSKSKKHLNHQEMVAVEFHRLLEEFFLMEVATWPRLDNVLDRLAIDYGTLFRVNVDSYAGLNDDEKRRRLGALLVSLCYLSNVTLSSEHGKPVQQRVAKLLADCDAPGYSVVYPESVLLGAASQPDAIALALSAAPLVNTSAASWEQILELRRDAESAKKLRSLRLFLHRNYTGKSAAYIQDDLSRRLDEYKDAARAHGFELTLSTLGSIIDSKFIQTTTAAAIAFAVTGESTPAALSAVASGVFTLFEVSRVGVNVIRSKHSLRRLSDTHELAYIIEATGRLS